MSREVPTAEFASLVYGQPGPSFDDPAEEFHEASRLYPNVAPVRLATMLELATSRELQQTISRASRTHPHRSGIDLPRSWVPGAPLDETVRRRRSRLDAHRTPLRLDDLSAVLHSTYRATEVTAGLTRRPVPSAGALYPLELYLLPLAVDSLSAHTYHYDPYRHRLERLQPIEEATVRAAIVDGSLLAGAAALLVVTSVFWRARFKYGLRGYRFALLEAGHVVQNAALAATALGLTVLPLGGFYDRRLDDLVGADGLDEATVYAAALGGRR